jgi:hypothetical protein
MADGPSQTTIDDCLSDPGRMLDELKSLTTQSRKASVLRTMFGADGDVLEPTKALAERVKKTLREFGSNSPPPKPPL